MFRWDYDAERDRHVLTSDDGLRWGVVEDMGDGDWRVSHPGPRSRRFSTLPAAQRTVECLQGIVPWEVGD